MQSKSAGVSAYLEEVPASRAAQLKKLRETCRKFLPGYHESMDYGMPCYAKDGVVEVAFASQKNYISLYILKQDVVKTNKAALAGADVGKGCIKYAKPDKMNFEVIAKLLQDTAASPVRPF